MTTIQPLSQQQMAQKCDPDAFLFKTTTELAPLVDYVGQERAVQALDFFTKIGQKGYNLYALGPQGIGKKSLVQHVLKQHAATQKPPQDICYVYNFNHPQKPSALCLPAGLGAELRSDMQTMLEDLQTVLPATFDSEKFQGRMQSIEADFVGRQEEQLSCLGEEAKKEGVIVVNTTRGYAVMPTREGETITAEEFERLPEEEKKKREQVIHLYRQKLEDTLSLIPNLQKKKKHDEHILQQEFADQVVSHAIHLLYQKYSKHRKVIVYFEAVQKALIQHINLFLYSAHPSDAGEIEQSLNEHLKKYRVNVCVDHAATQGVPVVYEDNPSLQKLTGRIDHEAHYSGVTTNFMLISAGALHRAKGGYLIIDAKKLLSEPKAWEYLKRTLYAKAIHIESLGQAMGFGASLTLEPEPIELDVKVVLLGDRSVFEALCEHDNDFKEIFKILADFEHQMPRTQANIQIFAQLIATLAKKEALLPFNRNAVAKIIDYASRLAEDQERLSIHMRSMIDLMSEADYWAHEQGHNIVGQPEVDKALCQQRYRQDYIRENMTESILRQSTMIDTDGAVVGQVNGLAVSQFGDYHFGLPARITAVTRLGDGQVVNIEREVDMSGPVHAKGMMILTAYLGSQYSLGNPLSLSASLVFEQNYSGIDGDSASIAELSVLLSSLSEQPIDQSLAVTGSVNQLGGVQTVGAVNEKIEGFFNICKRRGLTGDHGVLIPQGNIKNLMLHDDVLEAVDRGLFKIYPITTAQEAMALLMHTPAGERDAEGVYPEGTINALVEAQLNGYAEHAQSNKEKVTV